jgi:hypothetical protein
MATLTKTQNEILNALNIGCKVQVVFANSEHTKIRSAVLSPPDSNLDRYDERRKYVTKTIQVLFDKGYLEIIKTSDYGGGLYFADIKF